MTQDYYKTLKINRNATQEDIKKAFRKLAVKLHPDKNPEVTSKIEEYQKISEAYDTLKDPEKRKQYDLYGSTYKDQNYSNRSYNYNPFYTNFDFNNIHINIEDILKNSFYYKPKKDPPINVTINTTLEDSFRDYTKEFKFKRKEICKICKGIGGNFSTCPVCFGKQILLKEMKVNIRIPKGVKTGNKYKLTNMGHENQSGPTGDVLVTIKEEPHKYFKRDGFDLIKEEEITFSQAALGTKLYIDFLGYTTLEVKVKPGIQSGSKLRLPGKGAYVSGKDKRGDLIILIKIITPTNLTNEYRHLLEKLRDLENKNEKETE